MLDTWLQYTQGPYPVIIKTLMLKVIPSTLTHVQSLLDALLVVHLVSAIMCSIAANSASLSFQFTGAAVIGGHHTVLCVVLDGIPAGGMSEDLSVLLNLTNSTAGTVHRACVVT